MYLQLKRIAIPLILLLAPAVSRADSFLVDDSAPGYKYRGITVDTKVSEYYPADRNSVLYKVLKQAQVLSSQVSFMGNDGVPYKQHDWSLSGDYANLRRGIDCSRAIWYAFTRAGLPYNRRNSYLPTAFMHQSDSQMRHYFESCSANNLRLGDVLVYRGPGKRGRGQAGHTVMVLDPAKELAWGSHGWDKSGQDDTGVEVQRVVPDGWRYWDRRNMVLKACWRYKDFSRQSGAYAPSPLPVSAKATGMFPETALQRLTDADLEDKTKRMLRMMRNEMFARYGYRFRNTQLANYFSRQPWYRVSRSNSRFIYASLFSALERDNAGFIYQYEQDMSSGRQRPTRCPTRRLTTADLRGKFKKTLSLMRNEIYARCGFCFKPGSEMRRYFDRQSWYHCDTTDSAMVYNQRFLQAEKDNVNLIKNYEQGNLPRTRHEFSSSRQKKTLASKYLETSTKRLTAADLRGKSKKTLRLMRNEIYARRGFCFKPGGELRQYFDRQPWYRCNIGNSQQVYNRRFSQTEKDNVNLIKRYE